MNYESYDVIPSLLQPGVAFTVNRMSFGRRLDLMRRVRDIAPRLEYLDAGMSQQDKLEARLLSAEIDRLYLQWGLKEIAGLDIDGVAATPNTLASSGPESLFREALDAVKTASRLSPSEIKN